MLKSQTVSLAINSTLVLDSEANVTFLPSSPKVTITRTFLVAPISPDIILGPPFLHDYNPKIDFITGNIEFRLQSSKLADASGSTAHLSAITTSTIFEDAASDPAIFHHDDEAAMQLVGKFRDTVFRRSLPLQLPPQRDIYHAINLTTGAKPPYCGSYRLSPPEQQELQRQLHDYLQAGFLRPSNSQYGAPVLFVKKPDGSLRLFLDYRALNAVTIKDKTPVPNADDLINHTAGAKIFSKFDLRSAFHQLLIRPDDIPKSAITTIFGNYEWVVMPFGMANAPSSWQAVVNSIFRDILGIYVVVYLDDILVY